MAQPPGGRSRSSVRSLPAPTDLPHPSDGTALVSAGKTVKRRIGVVAGGGASAGVITAVLKDSLIGWLLAGATLTVLLVFSLVLIVVLIGPDAHRSRFDRFMSFIGLLLRRAPARYMLASVHPPAPNVDEDVSPRRTASDEAAGL